MPLTRRKITLVGTDAAALSLLAEADFADIVQLATGAGDLPATSAGGWSDAAGSDVVAVLDGDPPGDELLVHCPCAVVVIAGEDPAAACRAVLARTHVPRGRVLGIAAKEPAARARAVAETVAAVLLDRRRELRCVVLCDGERGEAGMVEVPVCVGARGVEAIL